MKLVIVDAVKIDSESENVSPTQTVKGTWVRRLPMEYPQLAEQVIGKINNSIKSHVNTAIVCSAADDSHAREHAVLSERCRPSIVLNALGINLTKSLWDNFANIENIFKIDAACASGIVGLDLAKNYKTINNGVVLVVGVEKPTSNTFLSYFRHLGAVIENTETTFAPFDQRRAGFVMADGAAILAVTTEEYAIKNQLNIIATIDNVDSKTILTHITSPSDFQELKKFIESVIEGSGKTVDDIGWWDAHATATPDGDIIEYKIFNEICEKSNTVISGHKGAIGHCMSASAVVEIVNAIECVQKGYASKTAGLEENYKIVDDKKIIIDNTLLQSKTFIKTSFGFGGRNGVAVITVI